MAKLYGYITLNGTTKRVSFQQLPPLAQEFHANEDRKRKAKLNKIRKEREKRALTLRKEKP